MDTVDSLARAGQDWGSWDAADQDSSSSAPSTNTVTENVFDIMRDGSLSQVNPSVNIFCLYIKYFLVQVERFIGKYGLEYSLAQRDEYGHTPTHWLALNGHAHVFR